MSFASLGLSEALVRAIEAAGYTQPTPVQQRAIPAVLQGRDLMVAAQTGTGKTGGFALPILERLFPDGHPDKSQRHGPRQPRVLVLTPTRELAAQVHDSFKLYARDLHFVSACIFGGVGMNPQVQAMAKGVDVLVACPGRLLDLAGQGSVDLSKVEILVLDEADRMLDSCSRPPSPKTSPTWPTNCCTTPSASRSRRRTPPSSASSNASIAWPPATSARCWRT